MEEEQVVAGAQQAVEAQPDVFGSLVKGGAQWINDTFSAPMKWFFGWIDDLLVGVDPIIFKCCALGLFISAMLWVMFVLKKEYVNVDRPNKSILTDLRLWTVLAMSPHVIIYWVFS